MITTHQAPAKSVLEAGRLVTTLRNAICSYSPWKFSTRQDIKNPRGLWLLDFPVDLREKPSCQKKMNRSITHGTWPPVGIAVWHPCFNSPLCFQFGITVACCPYFECHRELIASPLIRLIWLIHHKICALRYIYKSLINKLIRYFIQSLDEK